MKLASFLDVGVFFGPRALIVLTIVMLMLFATGSSSLSGMTTRATQDSGQPGRPKKKISFESSVPKEIKILKLRNYDDDNWFETFECEIENRSEKNIVYIYFQILLPQFDVENRRVAFTMEFGKPKAEEADNPSTPMLRPGDKYLFKIPPHQVDNLKRHSPDSTTVPEITSVSFEFYMIWFSDRTGCIRAKPIVVQPDGKLPFVTPDRVQ